MGEASGTDAQMARRDEMQHSLLGVQVGFHEVVSSRRQQVDRQPLSASSLTSQNL